MRNTAVASIVVLLTLLSAADAQEWTRFRGPNGTGVGRATTLPVKFSAADFNFRTELPGIGHSSPVLWGTRVFVLSADPKNATRYVSCVDGESGEVLWQNDYASAEHHLHVRSSYASSTPAVDQQHVYVGWSTPQETTLLALNHDGSQAWRRNLGPWVSMHGFGTSPILYNNMVILHNSQQGTKLKPGVTPGESSMLALDCATGEEIWNTKLTSVNVCYSVPFIYQPEGGAAQLICTSTGDGTFSLDPATGQRNWTLAGLFSMRTCSSPIFAGGHIFGSTGSGAYSSNYIVAVKPGKQPKKAFEIKNSGKFKAPYVPSFIAKDDLVFLLYDRGFASCIDARTGEVIWFERTGANFSGSPVLAGDKIYAVDEDAVVWVLSAGREYQVLAKNPLGDLSRSTPAIANGKIYFRTYSDEKGKSQLISLGG